MVEREYQSHANRDATPAVAIYFDLISQNSSCNGSMAEMPSISESTPSVGNNPAVGARFESRGDHPLAQVTCDFAACGLETAWIPLQPSNRAERPSPWDGESGLH